MALIDNIVSYWKLDETSGTTATDAVGAHNGTSSNVTVNQTGILGKAYSFNGTSSSVQIGAISCAEITLSAWVYTAVTVGWPHLTLVSNGWTQYKLYIAPSEVGFMVQDTANSYPTTHGGSYTSNAWQHVVGTRDSSGNIKVYLNGTQVGSTVNVASPKDVATEPWAIGERGNQSVEYMSGLIDEVGMWSRALSSTEVAALYNSGAGLAYPFSTGTNMQINIGDTWKTVTGAQINIGDTWKTVTKVQQNIGDVWKDVF